MKNLPAGTFKVPAAYQARGLRQKERGPSTMHLPQREKKLGLQDLKVGRQNQISRPELMKYP